MPRWRVMTELEDDGFMDVSADFCHVDVSGVCLFHNTTNNVGQTEVILGLAGGTWTWLYKLEEEEPDETN